MKNRFLLNAIAGLISLLSIFNFTVSQAQTREIKKDHIGFSVSFGSRTNKIFSDHSAIDQMKVAEDGGSAGLVWGNDAVETKVTLGYYYSASRVPHTIDLITVASSFRFYPLKAFGGTQKVQPYFSASFSANKYRLFGYYNGADSKTNYSTSIEPYLGNVTNYSGGLGAGMEVSLLDQNDFVKLFAEVNYYGTSLYQKSTELFKATRFSNQLSIEVGLSFGLNRTQH